jgi:hypothetical protein
MKAAEAIAKKRELSYLVGLKIKYSHSKKALKVDHVLIQKAAGESEKIDINYENSVKDESGNLPDYEYEVIIVHGFNSEKPTVVPVAEFQRTVDWVE